MVRCHWDECRETFATQKDLYDHLCNVHSQLDPCDELNEDFTCEWSDCTVRVVGRVCCIRGHIISHTPGHLPWECSLSGCGLAFALRHELRDHQTFEHADEPGLPYNIDVDAQHECGAALGALTCGWPACSASFDDPHALWTHAHETHVAPLKPDTDPEVPWRFLCQWSHCLRGFARQGHLVQHMRAIHFPSSYKPWACTVCGKRYTTTTGLGVHRRAHSLAPMEGREDTVMTDDLEYDVDELADDDDEDDDDYGYDIDFTDSDVERLYEVDPPVTRRTLGSVDNPIEILSDSDNDVEPPTPKTNPSVARAEPVVWSSALQADCKVEARDTIIQSSSTELEPYRRQLNKKSCIPSDAPIEDIDMDWLLE